MIFSGGFPIRCAKMAADEHEKEQENFDDRINSKIFDRQIRHWGLEAQKKYGIY